MTPKITLTYFHTTAMAEPVRMTLAMWGQPWEDKRLTSEEFATIKPSLPYNQLPVLELDGVTQLPQSFALLRFAGKLAGLYPQDAIEAAFADAAVECVTDNHMHLRPTLAEKDTSKQVKMRQEMTVNHLPNWLGNLEKNLGKAGGNYFAGNKLSIGDIAVVARLMWLTEGTLEGIPVTILEGYPLLTKLAERVCAEPKIAAYQQAKTIAK